MRTVCVGALCGTYFALVTPNDPVSIPDSPANFVNRTLGTQHFAVVKTTLLPHLFGPGHINASSSTQEDDSESLDSTLNFV